VEDAVIQAYVDGDAIPPPYHDVKVTDAAKLDGATLAYKAFMAGETTALPDIRDVFLDAALPESRVQAARGGGWERAPGGGLPAMSQRSTGSMASRAHFDVTRLATLTRDERIWRSRGSGCRKGIRRGCRRGGSGCCQKDEIERAVEELAR